jgi:hypothetical protein
MNASQSARIIRALQIFLLVSVIFAPLATSQLGEVAGQLIFQVQVGHNQTQQLHLLNEGNQSITVQIVPPSSLQLTSNKTLSANQIPPTLTFSPNNGIVPAHGILNINVTVSMPLNDTPYLASWEGIISAQEASNASNPGGAVILEGVAKIMTATPIPSTTTSTTTIPTTVATAQAQSQSPSTLPIIAIIILIIVVCAAYYLMKSNKKSGKKSAKASKKESESMERQIARLKKENQQLKKKTQSKKGRSGSRPKAKPKAKKKSSKRRRGR